MESLTVSVTSTDWQAGLDAATDGHPVRRARTCPVAQALLRKLDLPQGQVSVGQEDCYIGQDLWMLDERAQHLVAAFDNDLPRGPLPVRVRLAKP